MLLAMVETTVLEVRTRSSAMMDTQHSLETQLGRAHVTMLGLDTHYSVQVRF